MIRLVLPGSGRGAGGGTTIVTPAEKAELMAKARALVEAAAAKGERVEFTSPVNFLNINFPGGAMTAAAPPWSEIVKYDLNTGDIVWRVPAGVQDAPPEYNIPKNTGVQFPRNAPLVTGGGLIFLATGPERKIHAYDRDSGKELWQHSLPNGAEGMPATYQVNGRQFVVLSVAQATGTFPATFGNAAPAPGGQPGGGAGGQPGGAGGRQGRGGGGPSLPSAYIAFALPQ